MCKLIIGQSISLAFSMRFFNVRKYAWEISGLGTFLIAFSFGIAIGSLVLFVAVFLLSPTKSKYVRGTRFVTLAALAATMILMIGGFIVSSAYNEMFFGSYLHELDVYVAQTFIPFVINTLLCIAYFGANMMLSD